MIILAFVAACLAILLVALPAQMIGRCVETIGRGLTAHKTLRE